MIEAYRIGVNLALTGSIQADIGKVSAAFDALNMVIRRSQTAVNELAAGMRGLARVGRGAAEAWSAAANAMERAARASRAASAGPAAPSAAGGAAPTGGGFAPGSGMAAVAAALAARQPAAQVQGPGGAVMLAGPGRGGTFAGGPGSGGTLTPQGPGGPGGPRGPIPLNFQSGASGQPRPSSGDTALAATGYGAAGYALLGFVHSVTEAGVEMGHLQAQLRGLGFTKEQSDQALKLAQEQQRTTPGITTGGALELIRDLAAVTQNPKESLSPDVVTGFSRAAVVLGAAGKGNAIGELFKAMQMGELRGVLKADDQGNISTETLQGFLKNVITTTLVTGGRIGPSEQLQFLKSAGLGGAMLSNRSEFADTIAPILSMGAARAGTGVQAFAQQFVAGKMSSAGAHLLEDMGLIDLSSVEQTFKMKGSGKNRHQEPIPKIEQFRVGMGAYHIPPQYMVGGSEAASGNAEYIMKTLLPNIDRYMRETEGDPGGPEGVLRQRMTAAQMISARVPGGNYIGDVIRNYALLERDRTAIAAGGDRDAFANAQTDPRVRMQALSAALNGLMVALSGPVMDTAIGIVRNLTDGLNRLSIWATANPELAGRIVSVATALGTLAVAIAGISAALLVAGPMIRMAKFLIGGAAAGAGAVAGGTGLGGVLGAGAAWLGRKLLPGAGFLYGFQPTTANAGEDALVRRRKAEGWSGAEGPTSGIAPTSAPNMNVQLHGDVKLDGRSVGNVVANGIARTGESPGPASVDVRAGAYGGLMSAP